MASSAGKRLREQAKVERAQAKAERKAARLAGGDEEPEELASDRSESELIEDLGALHREFEAGDIALQDFEDRRDRISRQLAQYSR